jgi:ankyrin repeat protein
MLHKLIDEHDEIGAIKLIEKQGDDFNVNYEFNMRLPIFSVVNNKMYDLFKVIINHPKFDPSHEDGFGDSILQSLLYIYGSDDVTTTSEEESNLKMMIKTIISCNNFNFNIQDLNHDTAINTACEFPKMDWVVDELVKNKNVDINLKNDFGNSPLVSAISAKNTKAIVSLGKRPDLIIGEEEKKAAKTFNVNLNNLIKPTDDVFSERNTLEDAKKLLELAMSASM